MSTPKQSFSQNFTELEQIVERFEGGEIDIDEGLKEFERGLKLAGQLKKKLTEAENKIIEIKKQFSDSE